MNPAALGAICYELETSFAENTSTFATLRLPIVGAVDASGLKHPRIDSMRTQQYMSGGLQWIQGVQEGSFKTKLYLCGHGSTTSGATTIGLVEQLLGYVLGNVDASAATGTTCGAGSTSTSLVTTASGTFQPGSLARVGTANDGKGNGQFVAVATHIATALALLTGTKTAAAAADVVYSAINVYTVESPTGGNAPSSLRFLLQTANMRYEAHGCIPTDIKFDGLAAGQVPTVEITWAVAWWGYNTGAAFPSTVTTEVFQPAPVAAGSLFLQAVGTATFVATRSHRAFTLTVKLGMVLEEGPGGVNQYQKIIGARRVPNDVKIDWTEDAEASGTHTLDDIFTAGVAQQLLLTLSTTAGSAMAFYFPQINPCGDRPVQMNDGGINRLKVQFEANTGLTTTSDRTLSAMRLGFA